MTKNLDYQFFRWNILADQTGAALASGTLGKLSWWIYQQIMSPQTWNESAFQLGHHYFSVRIDFLKFFGENSSEQNTREKTNQPPRLKNWPPLKA